MPAARFDEIEREIERVRRQMEPPLTIRALWDSRRPSPTYILRRGEHNKPGRLVGPGVPSVLTDGRTPFVVEPPFPRRDAQDRSSPGIRPVADAARSSADGASDGESDLVPPLRHWVGQGSRKLRCQGRAAFASGIARLARGGVCRARLEHQGNASPDHEFPDLSAIESHHGPAIGNSIRKTGFFPECRCGGWMPRHFVIRCCLSPGDWTTRPGGPPDTVSVDRDGLVSVESDRRWRLAT